MPRIRITTELLEHLLDLPANLTIVEALGVESVPVSNGVVTVIELQLELAGDTANGPLGIEAGNGLYALGYEETEAGTSLVSAVLVPE